MERGSEAPVRLADQLPLDALQEAFDRFALFLSYDTESAVSAIAALCGCVSVLVPPPGMAPEDRLPCFAHGIAFGLGDVGHALASMGALRADLRRHERLARRTVADFVRAVRAFRAGRRFPGAESAGASGGP